MTLAAFLTAHQRDGIVLVRIEAVEGSTPREAGACMAVSPGAIAGTIGGGQLEFHCIDLARHMLSEASPDQILDIPLGPQMGQCCGGRVRVSLHRLAAADIALIVAREKAEVAARPPVLIFGAGHTGRALARALAALPFTVTLIDDRDDVMSGLPAAVTCIRMADPVDAVADAPANAAFVVLSHSHALDYRLTEAALARGDAAYVGMIGSATKRARFDASFLRAGGRRETLSRLTCPIGGSDVDDKRPEVIAALTAAELVRCLLGRREPAKGRRSRHESAA
ncbi:xanthine dehydrogenase accessory protein XdhC [Bosea sp. SSUT16]|jgi:xanthine dehydrogenase accessory protein XdhC|uniref:Xanthine dehydrogenase accessory protein XdhC n=1 Tax=Bosea spartocytisi TaxID=2773451 RepID=A0A927E774_9HYPH|nr:xanthine dehydrogenase accessory protein XdhC [Bosea spartocytisi]MBD3844580.1 xanthine dehydrogenase accessory protein XdhC [Bosea spartocytisi]MCT4470313.1 xanthine dehydrogenase accessory protein XdhC [Bosea spartocytisi]